MERSSEELYKMEDFYTQKGKEVILAERIVSGKVTFLWGQVGVCQADFLGSIDQEIPDWLVWITFLGEAETASSLGIKSQFGNMGRRKATPFWTCCLLFNTSNEIHVGI